MDGAASVELIREFLLNGFQIVLPILLITLVVALVFGLLQAVMQIQEQALSFMPKLIVFILALYFLGPWMYEKMILVVKEYFQNIM